LWNLCLSAQESPQGVPKELLEAKKLELRQEKVKSSRVWLLPRLANPASLTQKRPPKRRVDGRSKNALGSESSKTLGRKRGKSAPGDGEVVVEAVENTTGGIPESPARLPGGEVVTDIERPHLGATSILTFQLEPVHLDGLKEEAVDLLGLALCLERVPLLEPPHVGLGRWAERDLEREGGRGVLADRPRVTGEATEGLEDAVQITVMLELDQVPAVIHLTHLPEDTEGNTRLLHPAVGPGRLLRGTHEKEEIAYHRGRDLDLYYTCVPAHNRAPENRAAGTTDEENFRLMIQELIEEKHALMLARATNPEMTVD
jgi:hypothetical protein